MYEWNIFRGTGEKKNKQKKKSFCAGRNAKNDPQLVHSQWKLMEKKKKRKEVFLGPRASLDDTV